MEFASKDDAPTLMIHGDKDELVPIGESDAMNEAFKKVEVTSDFITIENAGHAFVGKDMEEAVSASLAWFDKHLAAKETPK